MEAVELKNTIVTNLEREKVFSAMATAEIRGNYFSGVDIAISGADGKNDVYRIAVIKHNPQKSFT